MSNNLRTRDGAPFNFPDGVMIKGVDFDEYVAGIGTPSISTDSPAFTGTPTAPTPDASSNNTRLATTAFVKNAISGLGAQVPDASTSIKGVVQLATDEEAVAGTNALKAITHLTMASVTSNLAPLNHTH